MCTFAHICVAKAVARVSVCEPVRRRLYSFIQSSSLALRMRSARMHSVRELRAALQT